VDRKLEFLPELVHPSVFIAPGAQIVGNVTLEEGASVWFNAVIRGDTEAIRIGPRTNVQDGCVLHADPGFPCVLGAGVTVAHTAIVHGAVVEDNVMIGMRAVVMNGARIGADSIVGVGAVVTAGTQIPPGSMVLGLPAKVRRPLEPGEEGVMKRTADHYVAEARLFKERYRHKG
jgi:carbonic anhydrase/acetyltransferase-like protein (isoleucine patch superfamily)